MTSSARIRFDTLWRREVSRFMKIKKQTLGGPLLETFLYISVFGAALGLADQGSCTASNTSSS